MAERFDVGIVGGGQLGMMLAEAAHPMGYSVGVLDPTENCPAAQVGAAHILGSLSDPERLRELAARSDVITYEIEHFDAGAAVDLAAEGHHFEPWPQTVELIQDKLHQKEHLRGNGIPVADFVPVVSVGEFAQAQERFGDMVVKTRRGGYDGRGNLVVDGHSWREVISHFDGNQGGLYAEKKVPFVRELSVVAARDLGGRIALYSTVETVHDNNICHIVRAPAQVSGPEDEQAVRDAQEIAHEVTKHLYGAGVFAIEMFQDEYGNVLVNEIAPRVHNSGHWTDKGARTSQFEQHIRTVTGEELGSTEMITPAAVMVNILGRRANSNWRSDCGESLLRGLLKDFGAHVRLYGKEPRIDRKIGHITVPGASVEQAAVRARDSLLV
jgi:phosphoribosylaminoimidazole carboxylase